MGPVLSNVGGKGNVWLNYVAGGRRETNGDGFNAEMMTRWKGANNSLNTCRVANSPTVKLVQS